MHLKAQQFDNSINNTDTGQNLECKQQRATQLTAEKSMNIPKG